MKYNSFYCKVFKIPMNRVLKEKYGKAYADEIMKKSRLLYRRLVEEMDDLGEGNPMAFNALFALVFTAPYLASEKRIPPETVQEMMRRGLDFVRFYFAMTDVNTPRGKRKNAKSVMAYVNWYTPEREAQYPTSFKVDFVGKPHEDACYYRITRCPICIYMKKLGCEELMPLFCELDHVMIHYQHGVLHRQSTIADGGDYCDYYITGDREAGV